MPLSLTLSAGETLIVGQVEVHNRGTRKARLSVAAPRDVRITREVQNDGRHDHGGERGPNRGRI